MAEPQHSHAYRDPANQDPPPVLDTSVFDELRETLAGDLDLVLPIYCMFFSTAFGLIESLRDQQCQAQAATLHTLKGSASMLGSMRLAQLAARLQQATQRAEPATPAHIEELAGELETFRSTLSQHARSVGYTGTLTSRL